MKSSFRVQPKIVFGEESLEVLRKLNYKKYLIITDNMMVQLNLIDLVIKNLNKNSEIKVFNEVEPNPSIITVEKGLVDFIKYDPDCVIALGGGSPIDACKAILYYAYGMYEKLKINKKVFFIAVPTTSGTGSEVTSYSVITNKGQKIALSDDKMLPNMAILNPEFLKGIPSKVVADTGMDVLTHSLEAYVSKVSNPFSDALAVKSIKLIFENLIAHYTDRENLEARKNVQYASCIAGMAFDNSSLGINHSLAHTIGAKFHIAHGRANAILLPYIIEVNTDADKKYSEIARELGLPASTIAEGKLSLLTLMKVLKEKIGIEKSFKDYGISFDDYKAQISDMIEDIKKDICTEHNPNILKYDDYENLLLKAYNGY